MEKYAVFAKNPEKTDKVHRIATSEGFAHDEENPDFIISLGGDGTFLIAERKMPGVPKLLVRDSLICFKCHDESLEEMLDMMNAGRTKIVELPKLQARTGDETRAAVNDIVVRNRDPRHALRFRLSVDGEPVDDVLIGDGIIVATPFGSTGYYRSVTRSRLEDGIGVAFNNLTTRREPLHLDADARIKMTIVRSQATLSSDNHPDVDILEEGDTIVVSAADEVARMLGHD